METTFKTFEISVPTKYVTVMRKFIESLGGKIQVRKQKKCGLDEALEDVKAGRVSKPYTDMDELWKDLTA